MFKAMALLFVLLAAHCFTAVEVRAQTTAFTYQGILKDGADPANGTYEFEFKLFDLMSGGAQQGGTLQNFNVPVAEGIFTVSLDFGAGFLPGADRFLDIAVRPAGAGTFTTLSPRQKVNSAPYSIRSLNSGTADQANNATQLGGVAANQYVVTTDPRMTDPRSPLANSPNYIQNTAVQQGTSNFSISGNGTAAGTLSGNEVNAAVQYNLGGSRILSIAGLSQNTIVGINAGQANAGSGNSFFGHRAGEVTTGFGNSYFGTSAGRANTTGFSNAFFGQLAGQDNTTGSSNSFFGEGAGRASTIGSNNSFFGNLAGRNVNGSNNAFFGRGSGVSANNGTGNSFFGSLAGDSTLNMDGNNNTLIGSSADVVTANLSFATAIGAGATVGTSDTIVLGRSGGEDQVNIPGNMIVSGDVTGLQFAAPIISATTQFNIGGSRILSNPGTNNLFAGVAAGSNSTGINNAFFGFAAGTLTTTTSGNSFFGSRAGQNQTGGNNSFFGERSGQNSSGSENSFFGAASGLSNSTGERNTFAGSQAGRSNQSGMDNVFVGTNAGLSNVSGSSNSIIGSLATLSNGLTNAGAFGFRAFVSQSNSITLGSINGTNGATADTNVGIGTTAPERRLHVSNGPSGAVSLSSADFVLEDNAAAFQHFLTPNDSESGILFGDPSDTIGGGIVFNNAATNNGIMFRVGGNNTRMTLDGSGNLGIGTGAPINRLDVIGTIGVSTLGPAGATHLCRNASNQISTCILPRPELAGDTLVGSIEELRTEITSLKKIIAEQQGQIADQRRQIDLLLRLACKEPTACRP